MSLRLFLLSATVLCGPAVAAPSDRPWLDTSLPAARRADLLVEAMTLDQKLALVSGDTVLDGNGTGVNTCVGHISGIPALGLPALCMGDGPAGVGNGMVGVTQFPAPVAAAATWNTALATRFGVALGAEHAGKGRNVVLAPTINIMRTPKWGRTAETLSEDPYLAARLGTAITSGIQQHHVIAVPKHFVANNQEWLRLGDAPRYEAIDARISERALREIYYPAFEAAVKEGKAGGIMCAYNRVNGIYACENPDTLGVLSKEWGFDGFVVADWYFAHRSTIAAAKAGLDISMPGGVGPFGFEDFYGKPLRAAVANGTLPAAQVDAMVRRIVTPMFRLGLVDTPEPGSVHANVRTPEHLALTREIANQGTVLLRNERATLPFTARTRSIAVIGDDAGPHVQTTERYGGFVKNDEIRPITPLDAIKARAGAAIDVRFAQGTLGTAALPAIPAAVLTTPSGAAGLQATYFATPDFTGTPVNVRTEPGIDQADATVPKLSKIFSARWEGTLTPPSTGSYRFSLSGGGEIRLTIGGKAIAYTPKQSFRLVTHGVASLQAGKPVSVRVDYSNAATISPAELRLGWEVPGSGRIAEAVAAAKAADVAVVFVSDLASEGADRTDLRLPGDQDALIEAVAAANPKTVVVLHTVGPVLMPWRDKVSAILAGWYPGEQAGAAIASLLFGDVNPSGRLPMTFPVDESSGPADMPARYPGIGTTVRYDEGLLVGYRWYDAKHVTPLYPFGFGLSYTQFAYSDLSVAAEGEDGWTVDATIRNTGERAGAEVPQLYVTMPAEAGEPPRQLKGFDRVTLRPDESRRVRFSLSPKDLAVWDETAKGWRTHPGRYKVLIGGSSRDLPLTGSLEVARR